MPGALETLVGECTLAARSGGRFTSTADLVAAHRAGDTHATRVWLESVRALAFGVGSCINLFDPKVVVIGGGIAPKILPFADTVWSLLDDARRSGTCWPSRAGATPSRSRTASGSTGSAAPPCRRRPSTGLPYSSAVQYRLACECTVPFGCPVEPLEYSQNAN